LNPPLSTPIWGFCTCSLALVHPYLSFVLPLYFVFRSHWSAQIPILSLLFDLYPHPINCSHLFLYFKYISFLDINRQPDLHLQISPCKLIILISIVNYYLLLLRTCENEIMFAFGCSEYVKIVYAFAAIWIGIFDAEYSHLLSVFEH